MAERHCPICNRLFAPDKSTALPFCSKRCKQIDLGRWLDEKYGLPYEREDEPESKVPSSENDRQSDRRD